MYTARTSRGRAHAYAYGMRICDIMAIRIIVSRASNRRCQLRSRHASFCCRVFCLFATAWRQAGAQSGATAVPALNLINPRSGGCSHSPPFKRHCHPRVSHPPNHPSSRSVAQTASADLDSDAAAGAAAPFAGAAAALATAVRSVPSGSRPVPEGAVAALPSAGALSRYSAEWPAVVWSEGRGEGKLGVCARVRAGPGLAAASCTQHHSPRRSALPTHGAQRSRCPFPRRA